MALTIEELKARTKWIGSSDVGAILGVSDYANIGDLWLMKTGRTEIEVTTNPAADLGDRLEPVVCQWVADQLGTTYVTGEHRQSDDGILRCQLDGWMPELGEPIESKTSGLMNPYFRPDTAGWGADGTDAVPFIVLAQTQFALALSGAPRCHVGAFLGGGAGLRHYVIEAHAELQAEIIRRARAFWTDHVLADVPPDAVPNLETLRIVRREPAKSIEIDGDLIERYRLVKDQAALVSAAADEAKAELIAALGDAEEGYSPLGTVTYMANVRGVRALRLKETS